MKFFFFTISLFLFYANLSAQNKVSIHFKDSVSVNGFGRIRNDESILFRRTEDSPKEYYDYKTVEQFIIYDKNDDSKHTYNYKVIEGSGGFASVKLLEIIKEGKVNLYQDYSEGGPYGAPMFNEFATYGYSKTTYYIAKNDSDVVTNLRIGNTYSRRFRKIAKRYFNDCPALLEKIKSKSFKRYGIKSVVDYYNQQCH